MESEQESWKNFSWSNCLKTDDFNYPDHYKLNPYNNSYIQMINESYYEDEEAILLSEKSIIPFYFSQLPLFLASHHHVKFFREKYDFDLFDDIIDHSYDDEPNNFKRMQMILNEVKRLNENKQEIIDFCINNKDRFERNKNLINKIVIDFKDSQYIKKIINE